MNTGRETFFGAKWFIKNAKSFLAILLLLSLVLIGQNASFIVYKIGILMIIAVVILEFTFNNISEDSSFYGIFKGLVITWIITGGLVGISILIAPVLTSLGR